MRSSSPSARAAVVLSCAGAPDGDINVVRALGRRGVSVHVVSEYANPPASFSRYCRGFTRIPGFTKAPEATVGALIDLARQLGDKPILFPTADPDLQMVTNWRSQLDVHFDIPIARPELVATLTDKHRFAALAARHGFPVPTTHTLDGVTDLERFAAELDYPVIIKPADTLMWARPEVAHVVGSLKALITWTPEEFEKACRPLIPYAGDLLVQRYIPGDDDQYYDLQAYLDRDGVVRAWFTAQKVRTSPPAVGAGCCVESAAIEPLAELGLKCLRSIGFTGLVDMDFKRDPGSGDFLLIEINPRTAAWNILPTASGINFPYIAYADLAGFPIAPIGKQKEHRRYLHFSNDFRAFRQYRQLGQWGYGSYLRSLVESRLVFQLLAIDDLRPFWQAITTSIRARIRWPRRSTATMSHEPGRQTDTSRQDFRRR